MTSVRPRVSSKTRLHPPPPRKERAREEPRTPTRVILQRRAPKTIRRHFLRGVLRTIVLVVGDLAAFATLRLALWGLRDAALLGSWVGDALESLIAPGYLGGWRYGAALLVGLLVTGTYGRGDHRREVKRILAGVALGTALALWSSIWVREFGTVVVHYGIAVLVAGAAVAGSRLLIDRVVARLNGWVRPAERVLFVGNPGDPEASQVCTNLLRSERMELAGWVHSGAGTGTNGNGGCVGESKLDTASDFWRVLRETNADTVVLCGHFMDDHLFEIIVQASAAAGCRLLAGSRYEGIGRIHPSVVWYHKLLFVELAAPSVKAYQMFLKRVIDIVGAAIGLALLAPLFACVAVAIKLDSEGPIFYRSSRWGRFGREIGIWKFRTMVDGAADLLIKNPVLREAFDANIKLVRDPRVTRVGQFLRRWSIDEFPQLYNVLIGEMSLVGPRPKLRGEEEKYGVALERVLAVRPGLTGLWQISGRSNTSYQERIALDERYVAHTSLWWDLEIILRTFPVVLSGNGAH